jgi:hypothetical protein
VQKKEKDGASTCATKIQGQQPAAMCSHTETHSSANSSAAQSEQRMLPTTLQQVGFRRTGRQQEEEGRVFNACAAVTKNVNHFYFCSA